MNAMIPTLLTCALCVLPLGDPEPSSPEPGVPSERALMLAAHVRSREAEPALQTLASLVAFDTWHREGTPNAEHPSFQAMTVWLKAFADGAGLDFADHGAVVVIGLGKHTDRLGVITHGDVQPADPEKWARSPFSLDVESEPGFLVGRGTQDDKGPIACALHGMKALAARGWKARRRIELIVSYTEESDWKPFMAFLERNPPPLLNVAFDAEYPVVVAEKGWCSVTLSVPLGPPHPASGGPQLASFTGGFFLSQVPEDAEARIQGPTAELEVVLRRAAASDPDVTYAFETRGDELLVRAHGLSVHSSVPEEGTNAITHLAQVLGAWKAWAPSGSLEGATGGMRVGPRGGPVTMLQLTNDLIGTGVHAELFGELAERDAFMGPLTLSFGTLKLVGDRLVAGINLRRPLGRSAEEVELVIRDALAEWQSSRVLEGLEVEIFIGEPHRTLDASHVPVLLETFRHYTGQLQAEPISIGGGTHARLVPQGVNFGPGMPGELYTGHSEHEFVSREQFLLDLEMYTSLLVDLAVSP
jgi:dipeptidase D